MINPAVLVWARETAGLSVEDAARRIGLSSGPRGNAADKLAAIESGERAPTRTQLARMASSYHRPLLSLYMAAPPRSADRGEDFRSLAMPAATEETARLDALVRDVRTRQSILRELIIEDEESERVACVGSLPITTPIAGAASAIRALLGVDDTRASRQGLRAPEDLFAELRRRIEAAGIFVVMIGDLGNYRSAISASIFRGFAVADDRAPLIVINDQDAKAAWSFTLVHELVHIFVGSTGVSGAPTTIEAHTPLARVERFCNDVAGEVLLPNTALRAVGRLVTVEAVIATTEALSDAWKVSGAMAAYRLWRTGKADVGAYRQVVAMFAERWRLKREREKEQESDSGPSYYVVRRHRLGEALLTFVGRSLRADLVTHTTAAKLLGVRLGAVEPLLAGIKGLGNPPPPARRRA